MKDVSQMIMMMTEGEGEVSLMMGACVTKVELHVPISETQVSFDGCRCLGQDWSMWLVDFD